jgi:hypothetical protein
MSRLWTNPPIKPDGTLDYARLTLSEICEDLTESLMDRVLNGGDHELTPYMDNLPPADMFPAGASASEALVGLMEELLRLEAADSALRDPRTRDVLSRAGRELSEAARGTV